MKGEKESEEEGEADALWVARWRRQLLLKTNKRTDAGRAGCWV
ncbi:hypothetical protein E2C01_080250 [Portunus trituberculatus]|uniref:Uncharacterized protein n=1 Tax=Portunus trituberculatus TaxID=210409 RepID=A0A5B7ISX8_PORTR|nr:hypothetical protein [Portunus trituberculatus]